MRFTALLISLSGCATPLQFQPAAPVTPAASQPTTSPADSEALAASPLEVVANPGANEITLTWQPAPSFNADTQYVISRSNGTYSTYGDIGQTTQVTFTDTNVVVNQLYSYVIYGLIASSRSVGSAPVSSKALAVFASWNEARYFPTLRKVAFGTAQQAWLAVGDRGRIELALTTPNFANATTPFTDDLSDAAIGPAGYVAVGAGGVLITSPDGNAWTELRQATTGAPSAALFDGNRFIVMNGCRVSTSLDVQLWTDIASCADGLHRPQARALSQDATGYVALADDGLWHSTDLINWSQTSTAHGLEDLTFFDNDLLSAGCSGDLLSASGEQAVTFAECMHAATHTANQFMVAGDGGHILSSSDAINWNDETTALTNDNRRTLNDIIATTYDVVAVGEGDTVMHRGITATAWTPVRIGDGVALVSVATTNNRAVAVGPGWQEGIVLTSVDGLSWARTTLTQPLHAVTSSGGGFVVVGDAGYVATSQDGSSFSVLVPQVKSALRGVAQGFGTAAVGDAGTIVSATDGKTFTPRISGTTQDLTGVAYGNDRYIAVGKAGATLTSVDGQVWTAGLTAGVDLLSVNFAAGQFLAVGSDGAVYVTVTGTSWAQHVVGAGIVAATVDGSTILAWGGSMLYASTDFTNWTGKPETAWRGEQAMVRFAGHLIFFGNGEQIELQ